MYHGVRRTALRYLISGGAGFIGSHLCEHLLNEGHSVLTLDNLITGSLENIEPLRRNPRFEYRDTDVTRPIDIDASVDCVMHLASLASPKDYLEHPIETLESGSTGTRKMLELARAKQATFLVTSTSECY